MGTGEIQSYWNRRAAAQPGANATTNDIWLRELEALVLVRAIEQHAPAARRCLDAGCGDGLTTLRVAEACERLSVLGVDFSPEMVTLAEGHRQAMAARGRVEFRPGDVRDLARLLPPGSFDLAITDRCLINLESWAEQRDALTQIASVLAPGGLYLAIENFLEGQSAMNAARAALGLPEIPVRWHNRFFSESQFLEGAAESFEPLGFWLFSSSYYLATRVLYSALCRERGEAPDYNHDLHRLAVELPWAGDFSPVRLALLRRRAH